MTQIIQCTGSISVNGTTYMDPIINVYYLSYNSVAPIYATPQIVTADLGLLDQLFMASIDANPLTTTRDDVNNAVIMLLEKEYTGCTFTKSVL